MVCRGANTTVNGAAEDEDSHDFCAPRFRHICGSLSVLRMFCGPDTLEESTSITAVAPCTSISVSPAANSGSFSDCSPCAACFRVLALRRGATLVTAATLRLFGANFAELPFVATKEGELPHKVQPSSDEMAVRNHSCSSSSQHNDDNDGSVRAGYRREGHLRRLMQVRVLSRGSTWPYH